MANKLVSYCSNSAGALGLAGTLVGMYSSFSAAGTDPNSVYVGISLALVSTLLGVAVSLLLETAETIVSRFAGKQLSMSRSWGDDVSARMADLMRASKEIRKRKSRTRQSPPKTTQSKAS